MKNMVLRVIARVTETSRRRKLVDRAAPALYGLLLRVGDERETDFSNERLGEPYWPIFKAVQLMFVPEKGIVESHLGGRLPTREEAIRILRLAHPWFATCLATWAGRVEFNAAFTMYDKTYGYWP